MNQFLTDLALAHQKHEGWFPGSLSQRNNNPGNLRLTLNQRQAYHAVPGDGGFARFPSYQLGFQALMDDLRAKITGHSAHINYAAHPTFLDYVKVYAPTDDGNNPNGYCQSLCRQLSQYNLRPETPLTDLAKLISGDSLPPPLPPIDPEQRLAQVEHAEPRAKGSRKNMLTRIAKRLRKLLGRA
jgi:hypothetical protein